MLGEIATLEAEFIGRCTQNNDVTQDRSGTILSMVWKAVHDLEKQAYELCSPNQCKAIVRVEGTYEHTHQVNCSTGADIYPPHRAENGDMHSMYGGSLTLITARIVPRGQRVQDWVQENYAQIDDILLSWMSSKAAVPTRRLEDMFMYSDSCFMANVGTTTNFFALFPHLQ